MRGRASERMGWVGVCGGMRGGAIVLTGKDVLVAVLALVFWPLPFQALVQVLYLLLLQTLKCERNEPPPRGTSTGGEVIGQSHVRGTQRGQGDPASLSPEHTSNSSQKPALAVSSDSCFLFSSKTRFSMSAAFTRVA